MLGTVRILALCATYNRCGVTLNALRQMKAQKLPEAATMKIVVVDDASTDGSPDAIKSEFSDITVIQGKGNLYWAGAMRFGFAKFWDPDNFTHLLVFNDDCIFQDDAISQLLHAYEQHLATNRPSKSSGAIVVGSFFDGVTSIPTYGGHVRLKGLKPILLEAVKPAETIQYADTLNMNLALINKECLDLHQFIAPYFVHDQGDFDFGLRVSKGGVPIIVPPGFQGICKRNSNLGTWEDTSLSLKKRLQLMFGPKGLPLRPRFHYLKTHAKFTWPLFMFWPYLRVIAGHCFFKIMKLG